jgi:hypothetical protein
MRDIPDSPNLAPQLVERRFHGVLKNQISLVFSKIWFRRTPNTGYARKIFYDWIWFSLLLMPFLAISSTLCLIYLFFFNQR